MKTDGVPAYRGRGDVSYTCPECSSVLAERVRKGAICDLAVECACGAVSALPTVGESTRLAPDYLFIPAGRYVFGKSTVDIGPHGAMMGLGRITSGPQPN